MKKWLVLILTVTMAFGAIANDKAVDEATLDITSEIIWYNCDSGEGIYYSDFEAFLMLKQDLKGIVSIAPIATFEDLDPSLEYSFLYFKVEDPTPHYKVAVLLEETLVTGRQVYKFDKELMDSWRYHNNERVLRNEASEIAVRDDLNENLNHCGIVKRDSSAQSRN
jgi:hypothetical protein